MGRGFLIRLVLGFEYQELLINEVLDPMFQIVAVVRVMTNSAGMKLTPRVVLYHLGKGLGLVLGGMDLNALNCGRSCDRVELSHSLLRQAVLRLLVPLCLLGEPKRLYL